MGYRTKGIIAIVFLLFIGICYYFGEYYHQDVVRHKQMYCYDTYFGPANAALYVERVSEGEKLITYYQAEQQGKVPVANFSLQALPTDVPVYVMGYLGEDSSLVEIVNYWDGGGKSRGNYVRGYVYGGTLHELPPAVINERKYNPGQHHPPR